MKRKTKIFFSTLAIIALLTSIGGAAQKPVKGVSQVDYKFVINGEGVDASKYLVMSKNNTTYVPLRFISEKLGASVDFSQGIISIQMMSTPSRPIVPTDTQKIQDLEKKLELVLKENSELRSKLEKADKKLSDTNVYKTLPLTVEDSSDMRFNLVSFKTEGNRTSLSLNVSNKGSNNALYFLPEDTVLVIDGDVYDYLGETGGLSSTLAPLNSTLGKSGYNGTIEFQAVENIKGAKGYITFYYNVNSSNDRRSQTIYFQN